MNNLSRVLALKNSRNSGECIVYWISREQRVNNNFALSLAQNLAKKRFKKLVVVFTLANSFLGSSLRQYSFMLDGLIELEQALKKINIPFVMLCGNPPQALNSFCISNKVETVVLDFDPLRIKQHWQQEFKNEFDGNIYEVDGHNIVPCRLASNKQEFAAYTIRPKIKKYLLHFLTQQCSIEPHVYNTNSDFVINNFEKLLADLKADTSVKPVSWLKSGEKSAYQCLKFFIENRLNGYAALRNNPNLQACSNLSIYLHFGQIYSGDIANQIQLADAPDVDKLAFLEELIIRKELSDNFCFYNKFYDSEDGFPSWAKSTLAEHENDTRVHMYSITEFENCLTTDSLWNAAQSELLITGKIHGYMRMYWAKKILEWSPNASIAIKTAIYLNDKYALDGRDPNGYTGIAWSIGGVHDRAWFNREIFGKVRYMNANGANSKFDTKAYINSWLFFR